jgi:hypothetical protein
MGDAADKQPLPLSVSVSVAICVATASAIRFEVHRKRADSSCA